jgi:hypothetical protein
MDLIIMEAIEIQLHPNNMNREDGFFLSKAWKPLIHALKEQKKCLLKGLHPPLKFIFLFP